MASQQNPSAFVNLQKSLSQESTSISSLTQKQAFLQREQKLAEQRLAQITTELDAIDKQIKSVEGGVQSPSFFQLDFKSNQTSKDLLIRKREQVTYEEQCILLKPLQQIEDNSLTPMELSNNINSITNFPDAFEKEKYVQQQAPIEIDSQEMGLFMNSHCKKPLKSCLKKPSDSSIQQQQQSCQTKLKNQEKQVLSQPVTIQTKNNLEEPKSKILNLKKSIFSSESSSEQHQQDFQSESKQTTLKTSSQQSSLRKSSLEKSADSSSNLNSSSDSSDRLISKKRELKQQEKAKCQQVSQSSSLSSQPFDFFIPSIHQKNQCNSDYFTCRAANEFLKFNLRNKTFNSLNDLKPSLQEQAKRQICSQKYSVLITTNYEKNSYIFDFNWGFDFYF